MSCFLLLYWEPCFLLLCWVSCILQLYWRPYFLLLTVIFLSCYAECHIFKNIMVSVILKSAAMPNVMASKNNINLVEFTYIYRQNDVAQTWKIYCKFFLVSSLSRFQHRLVSNPWSPKRDSSVLSQCYYRWPSSYKILTNVVWTY